MSEVVSDLLQGQTLRQQVGGASMPQRMRAVMRQGQAQRVEAAIDDGSEAIGGQGPKRCYHRKEYLTSIGWTPHFPQVTQDGVANLTAQRVGPRSLGFAVGNAQ